MYPISPVYADFLKRRAREWFIKAEIDGVTYDATSIVDFKIENSIISGQEFELGAAIASKLTIRLKSAVELPDNAKIIPSLAISLAGLTWETADYPWEAADVAWNGGSSDWMPLGEFYVDKREKINSVWIYTCYDKLMLANAAYVSSLTYPATMKAIWDEICSRLGYTYDSSVVINQAYTVPVAPTGYTMRAMLGYIASANAASLFAGKDGRIRFKRYSAAEHPVEEFTESDYIRVKQINPVKTFTKVVVTYDKEDKLTYAAGTGDDNHTLFIDNPFMTQAMTNNVQAAMNGFSYVPMQMDARGYPQYDVGDLLTFYRQESIAWKDADIAWDAMETPWDGLAPYRSIILEQTFTFKGGLAMTLRAPSKSEQASEFQVEGSLSQQVNRITQSAIRQDKRYYGVAMSKDFGLRIDRDDNKAHAIFNADELSFWANGSRALWFDVPNLRWKFKGTLEGADGTFSGTLSSPTIIGGSISGAILSGGAIYGTYIATGLGTYPFVELSSTSNLIAAYGDANKYVKIESNLNNLGAPMIRFGFNGYETWLMQVSSGFFVFGPDTNMSFTFNDLSLGGNVRVSGGASKLGSHSVSTPSDPDSAVTQLKILIAALRDMGILA